MKNIITVAVLFISLNLFAQVGINNTSPKATLDISPKTTDGSKPEGLIIPQLDGNSLKTASYGTAQKGVIVYAKSAASPTDIKTVNVTAEGYYYFDGSVWQKMTGASSGDTTNDAWVNDTTNGLVKLGTKADGTARAAGTDIVAKDDGSVDIGITNPQGKLDVNGNMILRNSAVSGGTVNLSIRSTNGTNRWGIGMDNLETGSGNTGGDLKIWNYADDGGYISSPLTIKRSSGSVGIGTSSPSAKLEINSTTTGVIKIVDGTQGDGKVLTSDANGLATWIPVGQSASYHNVLSSRSLETLYTNSTGKEMKIFMSVYKANQSASYCHLTPIIDGFSIQFQNLDAGTQTQVFYIVPPGATYKFVSQTGSGFSPAAVSSWYEYY